MRCTLLIPRLFWPRENAPAVWSGLDLPGLATLTGRARAERFEPLTPEAWLCQAFQVERLQDWPVAPLTLELDGGEASDAYWLRADPVHLRMDRDRLALVESAAFNLTAEEAQAFVSLLNEHFRYERITFYALRPKRWYVRLASTPSLVTQSTNAAAGADVRRFMPSGADALVWHRRFNEVQMLLHEHPLNAAREERGEPPVNSVWFWGGGLRTPVRGRPYDAVWSDDALAVALGTAADMLAERRPDTAAAWHSSAASETAADSAHLVFIDDLVTPAAHEDSDAWREAITMLEARWFAPLARALREGRLSAITLIVPGDAHCWRFEVARTDLMKFWRRAKPWAEYQ